MDAGFRIRKRGKCLGREYNLDGSLFPVQIKTRNENILYRPIYLTATINSRPFTIQRKCDCRKP